MFLDTFERSRRDPLRGAVKSKKSEYKDLKRTDIVLNFDR